MQGGIRVESEEGKGSSFIFNFRAEIPAASITADGSADSSPAASAADTQASNTQHDYHGKRILLVEDVEINREIVIAVLEPLKLEIVEAEDGEKAYDLFRANPDSFDLIFMDIHMPGIDGYEAAKLIRAFDHPAAKTVPIIAMTANVFKEDVEQCLAAGMNGHVGKPLDFDAVTAVLTKYLKM